MSLVGHKDDEYGLHTLIMIYYVVAVHCTVYVVPQDVVVEVVRC